MRTELLAGLGVLGGSVLATYGLLWYRSRPHQDYWGALRGPMLRYWTVSALLTAAAFLYMIAFYFLDPPSHVTVFGRTLDPDGHLFMLPWWLLFLVSAVCWAPLLMSVPHAGHWTDQAMSAVLWTTAAGATGLFAMTLGTECAGPAWRSRTLMASGALLMAHHWYMDAWLWNTTWKRP